MADTYSAAASHTDVSVITVHGCASGAESVVDTGPAQSIPAPDAGAAASSNSAAGSKYQAIILRNLYLARARMQGCPEQIVLPLRRPLGLCIVPTGRQQTVVDS